MKKLSSFVLFLVLSIMSFSSTELNGIDMRSVSSKSIVDERKDINWVSVEDIRKTLPNKKISIGLDVDDTMLFSAPLFYYGKNKYSPNSNDYLSNQEFWTEVSSTKLDRRFSIPKKSAIELVMMHLQRGDDVYFITGRPAPSKKETLTETIRGIFPKEYRKQIHPVVFASKLQKEEQLRENNISIFYGDADEDIMSAKNVGIEGIRFLRGEQSTNEPLPKAGRYGEKVLIGSNY